MSDDGSKREVVMVTGAAASTLAAGASVAIGIAVIALSLPRGPRSVEHYGSWDRFVL